MNLNDQLLESLYRELADLEYRMKRIDELTAEIEDRRNVINEAIAELRRSQ